MTIQTSRGGERAVTRVAATPAPRTRHLLVAFDPRSPIHPQSEEEAKRLDIRHGGPWMPCECTPEVA